MNQLKWLWSYVDKKYRRWLIIGLVISAVTSVMLLVNPSLTSKLVDEVIVAQNTEPLVGLLAVMMCVKLFREGMRYLMVVLCEGTAQDAVYNLRSKLFRKMQFQDMHFFDTHRTGELMTNMSSDMDWCRSMLTGMSRNVVDSVVMFVSSIIYLCSVSWKLTLSLIAVTPLIMLASKIYSRKAHPIYVDAREKLSEMNTDAQENIAGNRVVKAFSQEQHEMDKFNGYSGAYRDSQLKIQKAHWIYYHPVITLLSSSVTLLTLFLGAAFVIKGEISYGQLTIFTSLAWTLSNPLSTLGDLINNWQAFTTSVNKLILLDNRKPDIVDGKKAVDHDGVKGKIEFRNVEFAYGRQPILKDISFTINPGQTLAIMGPTGSGKTTMIQLMARFYDVKSGSILIDDCDVKNWKLQQLRHGIGTATQDVFLFSDTAEGNVAFGNQSLTFDEVQQCAKAADADGFIKGLPQGYDTIIGERGVGLSGGQRQRIALARAIAMRPGILVMDDTTSALDMETEKYIQEQLKQLDFPCTKVIIAQRISSVKDADLILVLKDGEIAERGTHSELLKNKGYYYETFCLQNGIEPEGGEA